jgi:predicted DNA-binding transcriptional regulator
MDTLASKQRLLKRALDEGWHYHYFYHEIKPLKEAAEVEEHLMETLKDQETISAV